MGALTDRHQGLERWFPSPGHVTVDDGSEVSPVLSASWFHAVYDSPFMYSGLLDADGNVVDANRLLIEGCGLSRPDIIGRPFWTGGWWSPDPQLSDQVKKWCNHATTNGHALRAISRCYLGNGTSRTVELGLQPILGDAGVAFVVVSGIDITEVIEAQVEQEARWVAETAASRLAEQRFRDGLDAMIDDVSIARSIRDQEGQIVDFEIEFANAGSIDGAGRAMSEVIGSRVSELYPSWKPQGLFQMIVEVVETAQPFVGERLPYHEALTDGTEIDGFWDIKVAKLDDGYISASRDITDIVTAERALRAAQAAGERERIAFEVLLNAALPAELPSFPSPIGVHYKPALGEDLIGGDWYDVIALSEARIGLIIADVAGHGLEAAAFMVQLRNVLRAVSVESASPGDMLRRANLIALSLSSPKPPLTTCCCAVIDLPSGKIDWSLAGHPPILLSRGADSRYLSGPPGPPLGVEPSAQYSTGSADIEAGDRIVLYTDGLIERRNESLEAGMQRLNDAVISSRAMPVEDLAEWLASSLSLGFDDVALVVVDI